MGTAAALLRICRSHKPSQAVILTPGILQLVSDVTAGSGGGVIGGAAELPTPARTVNVTSYSDLAKYKAGTLGSYGDPRRGDQVVFADGNYDGPDFTFNGIGTPGDRDTAITFKAKTNQGANLRFQWTIGGTRVVLWGFRFTKNPNNDQCGRVACNGAIYPELRRCEITDFWNAQYSPDGVTNTGAAPEGIGLFFVNGGYGGIVDRCYLHDPHDWSAKEREKHTLKPLRIFLRVGGGKVDTFHYGGRITRSYFGSSILRCVPGFYSSQADTIEIGFSSYPPYNVGGVRTYPDADWQIRNSIFDGTGAGGRPIGYSGVHEGDIDPKSSGVADVKISGVDFIDCTIRNFRCRNYAGTLSASLISKIATGSMTMRHGRGGKFIRVYCGQDTILTVFGPDHTVEGCVMTGNSFLRVMAGTCSWDDYSDANKQQNAFRTILRKNQGEIRIGEQFSEMGNPPPFIVGNTDVYGHAGTEKIKIGRDPTADEPSFVKVAGLDETNTVWHSDPGGITLGTLTSLNDVGPYAP